MYACELSQMPIHDSKRDSKCLHDSLSCLFRAINICLIWCVSCMLFTVGTVNSRCTCVLSFAVVSTQPMPCVYLCFCLPYNFLCVLLRISRVKKSARSLPHVSLKLNVTITVFDIHHIYHTLTDHIIFCVCNAKIFYQTYRE